jgi:hypothetical protein
MVGLAGCPVNEFFCLLNQNHSTPSLFDSDVAGFNKSMAGELPAIVETVQRPVP